MDNLHRELIEEALDKLAALVPDPLNVDQLKQALADKIPKAFYYQMLVDLLSSDDKRPAEIILTEAKFLVKLLLFKAGNKSSVTPPKTSI